MYIQSPTNLNLKATIGHLTGRFVHVLLGYYYVGCGADVSKINNCNYDDEDGDDYGDQNNNRGSTLMLYV